MKKKKFYIVTTILESLGFFKGNLAFLGKTFSVKAISSDKAQMKAISEREGIAVHHIPMKRTISLINDILGLLRFVVLFIKEKPDIVHGNTPKAGLLSMLASKIAGVKVRIYMCHGLRYQGFSGKKKKLLMLMEKLSCYCAHNGISVFDNPSSDFNSNHWLTCIIVDPEVAGFSREDIRLKMDAENIETRPLWKPMHMQPVFEGVPFYGDGTSEALFDKGLCLPSGSSLSDEGMSLSSIEGMAVKPFIASNVPGLKEVVGGYGLLFDQGDSKGLAEKVMSLISNKKYYNEISDKCADRAKEFDLVKMTDQYVDVYSSICNL